MDIQITRKGALYAAMCRLSYADRSRFAVDLRSLGYSLVKEFNKNGIQGFVAVNATTYVEVFRGSDEPLDWLRNVTLLQVKIDAGLVHAGFNEGVTSVWAELEATRKEAAAGKEFVVVGHSLGAALATLNAHRCVENKYKISSVFLYGSPRVGDPEFMENYNRRLGPCTHRYENKLDMVPSTPFWFLSIRGWKTVYRHVGNGYHLAADGKLTNRADGPHTTWPSLTLAVISAFWFASRKGKLSFNVFYLVSNARLDDHDINSYCQSLNGLIPMEKAS